MLLQCQILKQQTHEQIDSVCEGHP